MGCMAHLRNKDILWHLLLNVFLELALWPHHFLGLPIPPPPPEMPVATPLLAGGGKMPPPPQSLEHSGSFMSKNTVICLAGSRVHRTSLCWWAKLNMLCW